MKSCCVFIAMCVLAGGCSSASEISQPNPPPQWYKGTIEQPAPKEKTVPVTEPATPAAEPQAEVPANAPTPDTADKSTKSPATNTPKSETDGE